MAGVACRSFLQMWYIQAKLSFSHGKSVRQKQCTIAVDPTIFPCGINEASCFRITNVPTANQSIGAESVVPTLTLLRKRRFSCFAYSRVDPYLALQIEISFS